MDEAELVVGTICGGSDGTSGITANPVVGRVFDRLVAAGGTAIFEETGELIGCESHMAGRAVTPGLGAQIMARVGKAADYYTGMGHGSFSPGNAEGGLTTLEEKSLGAYAKSGSGPIHGVVTPGQVPPTPGLYLLDVVPEGDLRWGFPNINDNAEIAELIACGSHVILFTTGRGSVVGSAISPVIKVCANPETYARMPEDMDVDAGRMLDRRGHHRRGRRRAAGPGRRPRRRAGRPPARPSGTVSSSSPTSRRSRPGPPACRPCGDDGPEGMRDDPRGRGSPPRPRGVPPCPPTTPPASAPRSCTSGRACSTAPTRPYTATTSWPRAR